jgi:hypothetical protein
MKKLIPLILLVTLSACQSAPKPFTPEPFNFVSNGVFNKTPLNINVAEIRVVDVYQSPMHAPNVEHEFPTPLAAAFKQWVNQRMHAVGAQGVLEMSIDDASVKEVLLQPTTDGISGLFTHDQEARYDANIRVTMRLYDGVNALAVATGDALVSRSKSISEHSSVEDHQRLYDSMTRDMMRNLDDGLVERLNQYFNAYLVKPN